MAHCKTYDDTTEDQTNSTDSVDEEIDEFYFQSDAIALKGNQTYMSLLRSLVILESQRMKLIEDYDKVVLLKEAVLKDPLRYVEQLEAGWIPPLPDRILIDEVPKIDWSQYGIADDSEILQPQSDSFSDAIKNEVVDESEKVLVKVRIYDEGKPDTKVLVRGRIYDETKPDTFNKLWSHEEQRRLEELLIKYPPEDNETNRWRKIAAELGTRTPKQVCSRVQKYFLKLQRAGLPIPGRIPKTPIQYELLKKASHKQQRNNPQAPRPTTFFPLCNPPVYMCDTNEDNCSAETDPIESDMSRQPLSADIKEEKNNKSLTADVNMEKAKEDVPFSEEYLNLRLLVRVRQEKELHNGNVFHQGYKCRECGETPICGTRWHCLDCPTELCTDCVAAPLLDPRIPLRHSLHHTLVTIRTAAPSPHPHNEDNNSQSFSSQAYLDPNFLPH